MSATAAEVRRFKKGDTAQLIELMRALAEFEGYADDFNINEADLIEHGLCRAPDFSAWVVADTDSENLLGMAVTYSINWTYTGKPVLVLKELFVRKNARSKGLGTKLMNSVLQEARAIAAHKIVWAVLPGNDAAKAFYRKFGATPDTGWEHWQLPLSPQRSQPS